MTRDVKDRVAPERRAKSWLVEFFVEQLTTLE